MRRIRWSAWTYRKMLGLLVLSFLSWGPPLASSQPTTSAVVGAADVAPVEDPDVGSASGWQEARPGYQFAFPRDHAAHPPYRLEWWYYTGNVETAEGRRFGYQLTFFRTGVTPTPTTSSRWAVRDLYLAHFAISDIEGKRFSFFERLNRAGVHWAGADPTTYRVWNENWEARIEGDVHALSASDGPYTIALRLTPEKPPVLHGQNGFSQKGPSAGNASHYYSSTRMRTSGTLAIDGQTFSVTGLSWMDHEFGSNFLEQDQGGWDWFSLPLQDGRELMLFQIRRADGSQDAHASGTLVEVDGGTTHLSARDFTLVPKEYWQSPESGGRYPIVWTVTLPRQNMDLRVTAALPDQELRTEASTGVTYWEGSVTVSGQAGGREVQGRGYLEMTGYTGKSMGPVLGGQ